MRRLERNESRTRWRASETDCQPPIDPNDSRSIVVYIDEHKPSFSEYLFNYGRNSTTRSLQIVIRRYRNVGRAVLFLVQRFVMPQTKAQMFVIERLQKWRAPEIKRNPAIEPHSALRRSLRVIPPHTYIGSHKGVFWFESLGAPDFIQNMIVGIFYEHATTSYAIGW